MTDYALNLFTYAGVTESDWASGPGSTSIWLCAELIPAIPGVEVTFHLPTNPGGGPNYDALVFSGFTGAGTGYPGLAKAEWNGSTGPNYPTLTYVVEATTDDGSTSNDVTFTWHHAPDVGWPDYHTARPVLSATVATDNHVTLSWVPDITVFTAYRRIVWTLEESESPTGPWTDISNADPALLSTIVGPITTTMYYRVRQVEPIPLIGTYSEVLEVTPGTGVAAPVASWGVLAR
jgi:hypothetical protein